MINEKIKELMNDKEFVTKMVNQPTVEDAKNMFIDKGVPITDEELETLRKILNKIATKGTLSEEDLNNMSGGGYWPDYYDLVQVLGFCVGAAAGGAAGTWTGSNMSKKFSDSEKGTNSGAAAGALIGSVVGAAAGLGVGYGAARLHQWWKDKKSKK